MRRRRRPGPVSPRARLSNVRWPHIQISSVCMRLIAPSIVSFVPYHQEDEEEDVKTAAA